MKNPEFTIHGTSVHYYMAEIRPRYYFVEYYSPYNYYELSRYKDLRRIKTSDNVLIHETMYDFDVVETDDDIYHTVTKTEEGRIDVISLIAYDNSRYWWIIAIANNIIDPLNDIVEGTVLRIPPIVSLYQQGSIFGK